MVEHDPCVAYGQWTTEEAQQSSTWREIMAVLRVPAAVGSKLSNMHFRWFSDNQNVARILQFGRKRVHLQAVAIKVFTLLCRFQVRSEAEWVPRELNVRTDLLS